MSKVVRPPRYSASFFTQHVRTVLGNKVRSPHQQESGVRWVSLLHNQPSSRNDDDDQSMSVRTIERVLLIVRHGFTHYTYNVRTLLLCTPLRFRHQPPASAAGALAGGIIIQCAMSPNILVSSSKNHRAPVIGGSAADSFATFNRNLERVTACAQSALHGEKLKAKTHRNSISFRHIHITMISKARRRPCPAVLLLLFPNKALAAHELPSRRPHQPKPMKRWPR